MTDDLILVDRDEGIVTLTLNRPEKRNAITPEALVQLGDILTVLGDDEQTRVVILRGAGQRAFSSGFDLGMINDKDISAPTSVRGDARFYGVNSLRDFPCPIIAMIHGFCVGFGLVLAAGCDLRVADDNAQFCAPPARLGIVPSTDGVLRMIELVGEAQTREMFYTARYYDAAAALRMGLVQHVLPVAETEAYTYNLAREIAANSPAAVRGAKATINRLVEPAPLSPEARAELKQIRQDSVDSEDFKEGHRAFTEKRPPDFGGGSAD